MTKKILRLFTLIIIFSFSFIHFTSYAQENEKMRIVCSLFPEYDFVKNIVADFAQVDLLLKPGIEPHDFEPSAGDIKSLNDSDVFIYTGCFTKNWAEKIISSLNSNVKVIDSSEGIQLENSDPHIWLDISRAEIMIKNILREIIKLEPENSAVYTKNADTYISKLHELDSKFFELKSKFTDKDSKIFVFGGHFSFAYLMKRYDFNYISAYESEHEPSVRQLARVIKFIRDNKNKYFLCDKFGITAISNSISEQTGAKILVLDSLHNVSKEEFENNTSFLKIMQDNLESLRKFSENI